MKQTAHVVALGLALFSTGAGAQDYPSRPVTLVVPYAAGGGNDVMARIVAEKMSRSLGQQIVIENKGGAGGSIATRQVARAAPDGYTLGLGGTGTLAINPTLYPNVGYDPRKDFVPVGLIASSALVVAGIRLTHIPYKGSSPALTDLIGGHVATYFSSLPPAIALVREGKVRALAVTGPQRSPILPELPTVAEAALPGYEAVLHYGIVAPAGTPQPIIDKLNAALNAALAEGDVRARIAADGAEPLPGTPSEYAADIDREETKWSKIVKMSGAKVE